MTDHVGQWNLVRRLAGGTFGQIFTVQHSRTGARACAKIERIQPKSARDAPTQLQIERTTYAHLARVVPDNRQKYFPRIHDFGTQGKYHYMVMTQMKEDLESVIDKYTTDQKLRCLLDTLTALEALHDAGVLHRDIKPRNICIAGDDPCKVALIDLGLSKKFIESDGNHIQQKQKRSIVGTFRYCSVPALLSLESSRRDDIESLVYTFIHIFDCRLPWQDLRIPHLDSRDPHLQEKAQEQRERAVLRLKQTTPPEVLCKGTPRCLQRILDDVQLLAFQEAPRYKLYRAFVRQDLA